MKKRLLFLLVLVALLLATVLAGCIDNTTNGPEPGEWIPITVRPIDMFTHLAGGAMEILTDYSARSLKTNSKIASSTKLKITLNDQTLWATLKIKYDDLNATNAMLALEITTKEDSYADLALGIYLHKEELSVALGETKFKFPFKNSLWSSFFPLEMQKDISPGIKAVANFLTAFLYTESDATEGKYRQNGTADEYNYKFSVDLPKTLSGIYTGIQQIGSADKDKIDIDLETIEEIYNMLGNVIGISLEDITSGNFPPTTLVCNFTVTGLNRKLSDLKVDMNIDRSGLPNDSLFDSDRVKISMELINHTSEKSLTGISIDFVTNPSRQEEYVSYLGQAFRASFPVQKILPGTTTVKKYQVDITTKVFQEDNFNNYLFIEYTDAITMVKEKGFYIYENIFYYYDTVDGNFICLNSGAVDLSDLASRIYENDLNGDENSGMNISEVIAYFLANVNLTSTNIKLKIQESFFQAVWFNFYDLVEYVNDLFTEDLMDNEELADFLTFCLSQSTITLSYDKSIIGLIQDSGDVDSALLAIREMLQAAIPLKVFTPVENSDVNDDS